jgi:hypothetical protein
LVGGSNPSRGANFQKNSNDADRVPRLIGTNSNRRQKNKPVRRRRAAAAIARQGDPKGEGAAGPE